MNISDIKATGLQMVAMLAKYHNPPKKELLLDAILFAYLCGQGRKVARQHRVYFYGSAKPHRIDFRIGGSNPIVLEFAVRSTNGGGSLGGGPNVDELRKLCRVTGKRARLRALLLLDLADHPLSQDKLEKTYEHLHAGRGKFKRSSVRVIYVHREDQFDFSWSPFKPQ